MIASRDQLRQTHSIMVVDDDHDSRLLMSDCLVHLGYEVAVADSAIAALEQIRQSPPDLVILDLMMPRLDGFWLIGELKQDLELARTPIVIVSALSAKEWRTPRGIAARLQKPISFDELANVIESVLANDALEREKRRASSVLIIEDDEDFRTILGDVLSAVGMPVATAWNRTKAVEVLGRGLRPGVIVMDLMMPGMDASQFMRALDGF